MESWIISTGKRFQIGYAVTRSIWHGFRFALLRPGKKLFRLRIKNKNIWLRRNQTDEQVFIDSFYHQYHRPFTELGPAPVIIDLGSYTGLTIVDMSFLYPDANIYGVEPDQHNYELCKRNIAGLENCRVQHSAIWKNEGWVSYSGKDEQSYFVSGEGVAGERSAPAITIDIFMQNNMITHVDYLKMDIEGAEYAVLLESSPAAWLKRVKYLSIEIHNTDEVQATDGMKKIEDVLVDMGFEVSASESHWSSLQAVNKSFNIA